MVSGNLRAQDPLYRRWFFVGEGRTLRRRWQQRREHRGQARLRVRLHSGRRRVQRSLMKASRPHRPRRGRRALEVGRSGDRRRRHERPLALSPRRRPQRGPTTPALTWADRVPPDSPPRCASASTRGPSTAAPAACSTPATRPPSSGGRAPDDRGLRGDGALGLPRRLSTPASLGSPSGWVRRWRRAPGCSTCTPAGVGPGGAARAAGTARRRARRALRRAPARGVPRGVGCALARAGVTCRGSRRWATAPARTSAARARVGHTARGAHGRHQRRAARRGLGATGPTYPTGCGATGGVGVGWLMGGALSNGGNVIRWLRETLRLPAPGRDRETAVRDGARLPRPHVPAPARRRAWAWMGRQSQRDRRRALDEQQAHRDPARRHGGRGLQVRHHRGDARDRLPGEKEVVASGGGLLNSPTWTRIMADTLQARPITLSGVKEASSRGAALIALEALGGPEMETAQAPLGETFEPDPSRHEIYMMALGR